MGTVPLIALSAEPAEESFHAKPLANQCQWHTNAHTSTNCSAHQKVLNNQTQAIQGSSVNVTSVCINFIWQKTTFVDATSPWFANGTICYWTWSLFWELDLMINSLSTTRMSAKISVRARNILRLKPSKTSPTPRTHFFYLSCTEKFNFHHSHHLQQAFLQLWFRNTVQRIIVLKAATAGKVSISWPNHLGFVAWKTGPNGWFIGMKCMYIIYIVNMNLCPISRRNINPIFISDNIWYTAEPSFWTEQIMVFLTFRRFLAVNWVNLR